MSIGYKAEATSANLNAAFISKTVTDTAAAQIDFQGDIKTDVISESTAAAGVTIDGVLIKDNLVDGRDVSVDGTAQDSHIGDTSIHFTEASIDHANIQNIGTNSHADIDTHIADATIHFAESSIDHTAITNIGTNSHADIDTHIADTDLHLTQVAQTFTGKKTFTNGALFEELLQLEATQDSSTTGADAVLSSATPYVAVSHASLTSIGTISGESSGKAFILVNRTGATITIKENSTGTAAQRILTGTGANLELADNASLWLSYDSTEARWYVVGGSGSGGGVKIDTYSNLAALARTEGKLYYASDLNKYVMDDGTNLITMPNHDGEKNYLPLGNAETANPWTMYDDASGIPVDGTGGVTSATVTTSGTNPLTGTKSFIFTPHSSLGEGAAYAVTLDREDTYNLIHCDFSYEVASGTYSSGDLAIYLYDVTNARLISPSSTHLLANVAIPSTQRFTFQATDSTSYRLLVHQVTANSGYTIKFEAKLGPKDFAGYATVQSDEKNFSSVAAGTLYEGSTTNPTYGTVSTNAAKWYRDGKYAHITLTYQQTTSGSAGTGTWYNIKIPSEIGRIDTSMLTTYSGDFVTNYSMATVVGKGTFRGASAIGSNTAHVYVSDSSTIRAVILYGTGSTALTNFCPSGFSFADSQLAFSLDIKVPILGWSSSAPIISEYDGRVVAAKYYYSGDTAVGANAVIKPDVKEYDSHGCYDTSTGLFTVKHAGKYRAAITAFSSSGNSSIYLKKNGTANHYIMYVDTSTFKSGSTVIDCAVGDTLGFYSESGNTFDASSTNGTMTSITFEMLSGAQQIQAGHLVACAYWKPSSTSVTADTPIDFSSMEFDNTNGSITTGASWKFTAKANGIYSVSGSISCNSSSGIRIWKNGSALKPIGWDGTSTDSSYSTTVEMKVGDYIDIRPVNTITIDGNASNSLANTNINIHLIGSHLIDQSKVTGSDGVELALDSGNGYGSTNTKIRRFSNTRKSTGSGVYYTYADSAANGMSVTIIEPGKYDVRYCDSYSVSPFQVGISVNGTALTTNIFSCTYAQGKRAQASSPQQYACNVNASLILNAGDVVRAHGDGTCNDTSDGCTFYLVRSGY